MPRYTTVTRDGKEYKRRLLTRAEMEARKEKFRASMAATMAKKKGSNGHATTPAATPTNGAMREHAAPDQSTVLAARFEATLVHLKRGADWLEKEGPSVSNFDIAHIELLNARRALLGR